MAPRTHVTNEALAELLRIHQRDFGEYREAQQAQHRENRQILQDLVTETRATNGRVLALEAWRTAAEAQKPVAIVTPPDSHALGPHELKRMGYGLGAIMLITWGAVQAIDLGLQAVHLVLKKLGYN